jgi:hypothetical protein
VYKPALVIVPADALHVTPVLLDPLTVAVNCACCPVCIAVEAGDIVTETLAEGVPAVVPDMFTVRVEKPVRTSFHLCLRSVL